MSGTGRKSAYRKSVTEDVLNSFPEPDAEAGERIARVVQSRGGNILQVRGLGLGLGVWRVWMLLPWARCVGRSIDATLGPGGCLVPRSLLHTRPCPWPNL